MAAFFLDTNALLAVSPSSLSAYARAVGWTKVDAYREHSDVYTGDGLPEVILPRTKSLKDYTAVVAELVEIFARVAEVDQHALYRDLVTSDRDVVRVRVADGNGTVDINEGADLVAGARDMLLAAACSVQDPRPVYRTGANREANEFMKQVRLGQTEAGSFVVTLLSPVVPPPVVPTLFEDLEFAAMPMARRVTFRLSEALQSCKTAIEKTVSGEKGAFSNAVGEGVSANLCDSLAQIIEPFKALDISVTWARTQPMKSVRQVVSFIDDDVAVLREAAFSMRGRLSKPEERIFGYVLRLKRSETEEDGTVTIRASVDRKSQSVTTVLDHVDYSRAVQAHDKRFPIITEGDLERMGQRWRLLNPRIVEVIGDEEATGH